MKIVCPNGHTRDASAVLAKVECMAIPYVYECPECGSKMEISVFCQKHDPPKPEPKADDAEPEVKGKKGKGGK